MFGEKSGWERANWFEPNAARGDESLRPRGWAGKLWSPAIGAEHRACREAVAIFDESSFAKIDVSRRRRGRVPRVLCANRVAREVGAVTYTQMLNGRGGIECDFTVTRLAEERFRIVTGHGVRAARPRLDPPARAARRLGARRRRDVGARVPRGVGAERPHAPAAADDDRSLEWRLRLHAGAGVRDRRRALPRVSVTYVGELGWELYCPAEFGGRLWDTIWAAGGSTASSPPATRRSTRCGSRRATGCGAPTSRPRRRRSRPASASPSSSTRATSSVAMRSPGSTSPSRSSRCLTLDDPRAVALGSEPVRVGDRLVGRVTSGGYGYTVERSIAYAYLPADEAAVGTPSPSRSSASGSGARSRRSRSTTRRARGSEGSLAEAGRPATPRSGRAHAGRAQGGERIGDLERLAGEGELLRRAASGPARVAAAARRPSAPRRTSTRFRFVAETRSRGPRHRRPAAR